MTGKELYTLKDHTERIEEIGWSPDGRWLASGSWDNMVWVWDVATGKKLHKLEGHRNSIEGVAVGVGCRNR
jgi:WD40 repeat protein